jgi:hypothetical protein
MAGTLHAELTLFTKAAGPLTKRIEIVDGKLVSGGSACMMARGTADCIKLNDIHGLAVLIGGLRSDQALALGTLAPGLPDRVDVVTTAELRKLNGARDHIIARSAEYLVYRLKRPALALLDFDTKGMPVAVAARIAESGGFWRALVSIMPELADTARVLRHSTSAGLYRTDTGEKFPHSGGIHAYLAVQDGADVERFLRILHERCWLVGLGWGMVGAAGQFLERSIVDRVVGAPERLVFEGAPVLVPPLAQDATARKPHAVEGDILDTGKFCPPLTLVETALLREARAKEVARLAPEAAVARQGFIRRHVPDLAKRAGISAHQAERILSRQCAGVLLPAVVLPFDDDDLAGATVADVIANPSRFEGATLADPLEGPDYGHTKAKIMRGSDGALRINSFAHGGAVYELKLDAKAAEAALTAAPSDQIVDIFIRLSLAGDFTPAEAERLRDLASRLAGTGKRAIDSTLKQAKAEATQQGRQAERDAQFAQRQDPRPLLPAPRPDAERLPIMHALDEILAQVAAVEPPMRDFENYPVEVRCRRPNMLHELLAETVNAEPAPAGSERPPAAEFPLITRHDDLTLAHLVERHIEFYRETKDGRESVALCPIFIRHYAAYRDSKLPTVHAVQTMPLVHADGTLLAEQGLDHKRGIVFRIPRGLHSALPEPKACRSTAAVARAMKFLTHEWLCDVATDYGGRCILIAFALTVIERVLLPERPGFIVTGGMRGAGKTTALRVVLLAATGFLPAAAGWSPSEEERRKSLFSYLREGVPAVVWDNIPRGLAISCPAIEKSLTSATVSDRILGETKSEEVPASTIPAFTGNNISARGDLASRLLKACLCVEQPDPENRQFRHPDPVAWTAANRSKILNNLYTILLGNPRLYERDPSPPQTRFKRWYHLIGSAIEHAAKCVVDEIEHFVADEPADCRPSPISFKEMFLAGEAEDEQTSGIATVLEILKSAFADRSFKAAAVADILNEGSSRAAMLKTAVEQATGKALDVVPTAATLTWRLKALADAPVNAGGDIILKLKYLAGGGEKAGHFRVEVPARGEQAAVA